MIESLIKLNQVELQTWVWLTFLALILMNILSTGVIVVMHYWPRKNETIIKKEVERIF